MEWLLRCQVHLEIAKCDEEIEQLQTAEAHYLKALSFDDERVYTEQLTHCLHRLRLRSELYKTPDRREDQVAMILEQCNLAGSDKHRATQRVRPAVDDLLKMTGSGSGGGGGGSQTINTHSLLLRAADLLAPGQFQQVLESELFKLSFAKLNDDRIAQLHKKSLNYSSCIVKCDAHIGERIDDLMRDYKRKRAGSRVTLTDEQLLQQLPSHEAASLEHMLSTDYKERIKLWFDLLRIARKKEIWTICRISCRFCLLYDKREWTERFLKLERLFDRELMRNLAEAHFIFGEVLT